MPSLRNRFVAAATTLALIPASASAGVVVAASGPSAASYPVGKTLGNSDRIVLRVGDTLTVLDGTGTRVLRGAGNFALGQRGEASKRSTFAALTERRSATRMRTGAVRGTGMTGQVTQPNLWYVDVARAGKVCIPSADSLRLWRASATAPAKYTVTASSGPAQTVLFDEGEALARWDTTARPLIPSAAYRISGAGGVSPGPITFVTLAQAAAEPEALAQQLIANGCTAQLDLLANATLIAQR